MCVCWAHPLTFQIFDDFLNGNMKAIIQFVFDL